MRRQIRAFASALTKMKKLALLLAFVAPTSAFAEYISIKKEPLAATGITAATLASTRYTGWIKVSESRSVVFENAATRAAYTNVTMQCWTSDNNATANGSGFVVDILSDSGTVGTSDSTQHTWRRTSSSTMSWSWTVANLPHNYVNCGFSAASGGASDLLTVKSRGVTP